MAATGYTPISLYYSTTASAVPTSGNLANGELGLNIADMKLYAKNSAGTVTLLASNAGASGSVTSVSGTGTVNGLTLTGTVTTSGSLTLGGTLSLVSPPPIGSTTPNTGAFTTLSATGQLNNNRAAGADTYINHITTGVNNTVMGFNNSGSTNANGVPNNTAYYGSLNTYSTAITGNGAVIATFVSSAVGAQGISVNGGVTATASSGYTAGNLFAYDASAVVRIGANAGSTLRLFSNGVTSLEFGSAGQFGIGGATYGTAGQVLTSGGSGAAPTWTTPSSGVTTGKSIAMAMIFGF